jgi:2-isopropylmalate synthase
MIKIFDTTLRDGEQSPGFAMNTRQKLLLAKQLEKLGVDVIEAGFPNASPEDFEAVKLIAEACTQAEICALARCHEKDIEAAMTALKGADKPRIHVFIATSDIHLKHKLKISHAQAIEKAVFGVKMAKTFTPRVDFSPEDCTRSERGFLIEILSAVIEAGADTLNLPDTVGYMTPYEYGDLIGFLRQNVKGIENVIISTHCHNDLGLAVANSLAGVLQGARQIECTINGIGERAGNASLEEVVMVLKTRQDVYGAATQVDTTQLLATSHLLSKITGQKIQANKAIVGKNAFAHGSGIHQHGMVSERSTYEIMKPEDVGFSSTHISLSKHSGRHGLTHRLNALGIHLSKEKLDEVFVRFKALASKKKLIDDKDLVFLSMQAVSP